MASTDTTRPSPAKPPTLREVARLANVSDTSVSFVLRGRSGELGLSPALQSRVRDAALTLGYRPHRAAAALRQQRTQVIGFVAPNAADGGAVLQNYNVHPFVVGLSHRLVRDQYHIAYLEVGEFEPGGSTAVPDALRERFFDALVVHHGVSAGARAVFQGAGIPILWWDSGVFEAANCIYRDETGVARDLTRRLIGLGHRRIAFMVGRTGWERYRRGEPTHYSYAQRYESYCAEMAVHGLGHLEIVGYEVASVAAQLKRQRITAVLTQGAGSTAPLFMEAARMMGRRIPDDLSLAALDIEARLPPMPLPMAGMTYDRYAAGGQAAGMLLEMLRRPDRQVPSVKLGGEFREGATLGPVRKPARRPSAAATVETHDRSRRPVASPLCRRAPRKETWRQSDTKETRF